MTNSSSKVTVIIPNWNGRAFLPECLKGLFKQDYKDFSVILVDNGSTDDSLAFVRAHYPQIHTIYFEKNRGFSVAVNAGIRASQSEYIALLNTDTRPKPDWLSNLVKVLDTTPSNIGSLASKMLDMNTPGLIENAGDILSWQGAAYKRGRGQPAVNFNHLEEVFSPCAGAALYRGSFLEKLGGFDEHFFAYLEDVDLGLRGHHSGYHCLFVPTAEILHAGHGSGIAHSKYVRLMTRNRLLLLTKNLPLRLLRSHFMSILYGQLYFFIAYKRPLHSLLGYLSFLLSIPHALKKRKEILQSSKLSLEDLNKLLEPKMTEPPLSQLVKKWIKGLLR